MSEPTLNSQIPTIDEIRGNPKPHWLSKARIALQWRLRNLLGASRTDRMLVSLASIKRATLHNTTFVAIGGTAGKTTAKELCRHVLASAGQRVHTNEASLNTIDEVALTVLATPRSARFGVVEVSEHAPGQLVAPLALLRPAIGVLTVVGEEHMGAFQSRDEIAKELTHFTIALQKQNGILILNEDDPWIAAMGAQYPGKVLRYGRAEQADLRASQVESHWPARLSLTVHYQGQALPLLTRLCGEHWVPAVLAALSVGIAAGLSLQDCVAALATAPAFEGRMQPIVLPGGISFIRDDYKAPLWGMQACYDFMQQARASRKIAVIGNISDGGNAGKRHARVALGWLNVADLVIVVGPWASSTLKAQGRDGKGELKAFLHVRSAADYLKAILQPGDLVLLKGTSPQDHLLRILLHQLDQVQCWQDDCGRAMFCTDCPLRLVPSLPVGLAGDASASAAVNTTPLIDLLSESHTTRLIVGLGNPQPQYAGSPHNAGHSVVDLLVQRLGLTWQQDPAGWFATGSHQGQALCIVKLHVAMNLSGQALSQLLEQTGCQSAQCTIVFDDMSLPLGSARLRRNGSAGGHRGMQSILEAFQTDQICRVKVGVRPADMAIDKLQYLITPLAAAASDELLAGCQAAVDLLLTEQAAPGIAQSLGKP